MSASIWNPAGTVVPTSNADNTLQTQVFVATAGQTVFTLTLFNYQPASQSLLVEINGVGQVLTQDYLETSASVVTLVTPAELDDQVVIRGYIGGTAAVAAGTSAAAAAADAVLAAAAAATAVAAISTYSGFKTTSTSSVLIGVGSKTFTVAAAGLQYTAGVWVTIVDQANSSNWMYGQVTSYVLTTLIVNVTSIGGSGTKAAWDITLAGIQGATGATGTAGTTAVAAATGTVDAITATFVPAIANTDMQTCIVVCAGSNTITNPTFAPNGATPRTITMKGGQPLEIGSIGAAGFAAMLEYNLANTRWELLNPAAKAAVGSIIYLAQTAGGF